MNLPDELTVIEKEWVCLEQVGHAGIKDIHEIQMCSVRNEGDSSIHTIRFVGNASLVVHYSKDGNPLAYEAENLKFEQLGNEILISVC